MRIFRTAVFMIGIMIFCSSVEADEKNQAETKTQVMINDSTDVSIDTTVLAENAVKDKIIVYYFHGTRRCATCKKLEAYSEEAIKEKFQKEIESGQLEFLPINFDEEENKHFINDYELYTKALVICEYDNDKQVKWKNLDKIWELVNSKEDYFKYVQDEIGLYLKDSSDE